MDLVNISTDFLIKLATFLYEGVDEMARNNNVKTILQLVPAEIFERTVQYLYIEGIDTDVLNEARCIQTVFTDRCYEQPSTVNHSNDQSHEYIQHRFLCKLIKYVYKAVDITTRDKYCLAALHLALRNNLNCVVDCLLVRGVSAVQSDRKGRSALYYAVESRCQRSVESVLNVGVDIDEQHGYEAVTAVHLAVKLNCADIVKVLIENRADVNIPDKNDVTPLSSAIRKVNIGIVQALFCGGADPRMQDNHGDSALHDAARHSAVLVEMILSKGVDVNVRGHRGGWFPLMVAANVGRVSTLLALLKHGADVCLKNDIMQTALHWADTGRVVEILLEWGADIDTTDATGDTPLHLALERGKVEAAEALLTLGARVDLKNTVDHTFADLCNSSYVPVHLAKRVRELMIKFKQAGYKSDITDMIEERVYSVTDVFTGQCSLEVERMKEVRSGRISLYDVLIRGLANCSFAVNAKICEVIQNKQLETEFPHYHSILRRHLRFAKRRKYLLGGSVGQFVSLLEEVLHVKIPEEVGHIILSHLSIADLIHLNVPFNRC